MTFTTTTRALFTLVVLGLSACGGGGGDPPPLERPPADSPEEAQAIEELLRPGLPALIAFRKPEFAELDFLGGRRLFERETFAGNGRTCLTCHSRATGTVSPQDAQHRHASDPADPLFLADGSDDGQGTGATRMLKDATVLVRIALPANVSLANDLTARSVVLRRGIPSTLNTPALDAVLMQDGRQPDLLAQAHGAIADHAQAKRTPRHDELQRIAAFQHTPAFFSSLPTMKFAYLGVEPGLPDGRTDAEKRGRRFFIDAPPSGDLKTGLCA
ncbi:MAG: hypothetical protein ABW220_07220, partial [Burkholderiaceae bacterium]